MNRAGAYADIQVKIKYVTFNLICRQCLDIKIKYVKYNFSMLNLMFKKYKFVVMKRLNYVTQTLTNASDIRN